MITVGCKEHPNYAGIRKPRFTPKHPLGCFACNAIFNLKRGRMYAIAPVRFVAE